MGMKKFVIFDLDGTLIDTVEGITIAANKYLSSHNIPFVYSRDDIESFIGNGAPLLFKRMMKNYEYNENDYRSSICYDKTTGNTITTNNFYGKDSDTFILKEPNGNVRTFPKMNVSCQDICANDGVIIAVEDNDIAFYDEKTGNYLGSQAWPGYVTYKKTNQVPEGYLNNTFANYKNEHSLENYYAEDSKKNGRFFELESVTHLGGNRYAVLANLPKTSSQTDGTSTFGDLIYEVEYSFTD